MLPFAEKSRTLIENGIKDITSVSMLADGVLVGVTKQGILFRHDITVNTYIFSIHLEGPQNAKQIIAASSNILLFMHEDNAHYYLDINKKCSIHAYHPQEKDGSRARFKSATEPGFVVYFAALLPLDSINNLPTKDMTCLAVASDYSVFAYGYENGRVIIESAVINEFKLEGAIREIKFPSAQPGLCTVITAISAALIDYKKNQITPIYANLPSPDNSCFPLSVMHAISSDGSVLAIIVRDTAGLNCYNKIRLRVFDLAKKIIAKNYCKEIVLTDDLGMIFTCIAIQPHNNDMIVLGDTRGNITAINTAKGEKFYPGCRCNSEIVMLKFSDSGQFLWIVTRNGKTITWRFW